MLNRGELLQKEPKSRHHEPEPHEGKARADPGKQRPLGGEIVAHRILLGCCGAIHPHSFGTRICTAPSILSQRCGAVYLWISRWGLSAGHSERRKRRAV